MNEPIQFGAPVAVQQNIQAVEKDVSELAPEVERAAEEFVHTHESILTDLMKNLEGIAHLGKSEIVAVVSEARAKFVTL